MEYNPALALDGVGFGDEKCIGKIEKARFGLLHDRENFLGLHLTFSASYMNVDASHTANMLPLDKVKFSKAEQEEAILSVMEVTSAALKDAKVTSVEKLVGKPVLLRFERHTLTSWRILTEVV